LDKQDSYITVREAKKITGILSNRIYNILYAGLVDYYKNENGRKKNILIKKSSLLEYMANHKSNVNPYGSIQIKQKTPYYFITGYDSVYATTTDGDVINLSTGNKLKPCKNGTDYYCVTLTKNGEERTIYVHQLVAETQVPNSRYYKEIHHIDKNTTNNKAKNLVYVESHAIHSYLHKIMETDKKAYRKMIKEIQKRNKEKVYKVNDPELSNDQWTAYLELTKAGYNTYKSNGIVDPKEIVRQFLEFKKGKGNGKSHSH